MNYYASFKITADNCLNNRAINYGDGVFETLLVEDQEITLWDLHWKRLYASLQSLKIQPPDETYIRETALGLTQDRGCYVLKLVVFRDDHKRGYLSESNRSQFYMTLNSYNKSYVSDKLTLSSVKLSKQRKMAGLKHLNRLEQVIAAQNLIGSDYTDAIMCDTSGNVIETINKNIILFKGNKIYSPKLKKSGVHGVALRWLYSKGHEINWKKIEFKDMAQYHGMMVCNSIQGFNPITHIDNKKYYKKQSPLSNIIQQQWSKRC